jgi:WD40 repeat protein
VFPVMIGKSGEFAIGSDCSRLNLSENEAVGLERLATAIDASSKAGLKARSAFRFCAFISYSHKDKIHARWLHRRIEAFKMPKSLVGRTTPFGRVGRTLGKAFRDDEELKGAADLGTLIQGALDESESLIVVCSPKSASSTYVNEEIASFKRLGKEARIVPVIIDGTPHGTESECLPAALKRRASADGLLTNEPAEPIAVDVRVHGKRRTLLKVIAGITGVDFDELERRDRRRRATQIRAIAASAILILGALLAAGAIVDQDKGHQAITARASDLLAVRQSILAAHLAIAGLPRTSDIRPRGGEAASTLKASGYAFATRVLDPHRKFHEADLTWDGTRLITRSYEDVVSIWNVLTGTTLADLDFIHYGAPTTFREFRLSPNVTRVLTSNSQEPPQLWDAQNGSWIATLGDDDFKVGDLNTVEFSNDDRWIVVPFANANAALFEAATGRLVASFARSSAVATSVDCSRVVTRGDDGTVTLWAQTGERIADLATGMSRLSDLRLSPDGTRAAVMSRTKDSSVTLWDTTHGKPISELRGQEGVYRFEMSKDGKRVATTSFKEGAILWDTNDGHRIASIGRSGGSTEVKFSGDFVVTSSTGGASFVSNAKTGEPIGEIGTAEEGAGGLYFIPAFERVVLATKSIGLVLRNSRTGALIARLADDNNAYGLQISTGGRFIQAKDANHAVSLWNGKTGTWIGALAGTREGHRWMIDENNIHAVTHPSDGTVRLRRVDVDLEALSPTALRDHVCGVNRDLIGTFPAEERNANTRVGLALRGRPWRACDWSELKSFEGWVQLIRYWGTRAGLRWDYEAWETAALDKWIKAKPANH